MIKLRLFQTGKKHQRQFRIVVMEARTKRQGAYLESLGWYNPRTSEIKINAESARRWIEKGAQPTVTVKNFLIKEGIIKQNKK